MISRSLLALLVCLGSSSLLAQAYHAHHDQTKSQFQSHRAAYKPSGYRLLSLSIYGSVFAPRYAEVWVKRTGPQTIEFQDLTNSKFQSLMASNAKGYTARIVTARGTGTGVRFAGMLEVSNSNLWVRHGIDLAEFQVQVSSARSLGWKIASLDVYGSSNDPRHVVSFEPNPQMVAWGVIYAAGVQSHQDLFDGMIQGYSRAAQVVFNDDSSRFVSVWEDTEVGLLHIHHDMTSTEYQSKFDRYKSGFSRFTCRLPAR